MSIDKEIIRTINHVIDLLKQKKYKKIEDETNSMRLTAEDIELAFKEYANPILYEHIQSIVELDIIEIWNATKQSWSIRYDFRESHDSISDLSLEITIINRKKNEILDYSIDNIHVL